MSKVSETFCILPWVHLSTRPDGSMRVCCTANASSVGPTNDKEHGGQVGILKDEEGRPNNLNVSDFSQFCPYHFHSLKVISFVYFLHNLIMRKNMSFLDIF